MFNKLPKHIRMISSKFKSQLDKHLRNISDLPWQPGCNNRLDGGHYADATEQDQVSICMLSSCSVVGFKSQHDSIVSSEHCGFSLRPGFNNSLDGGYCLNGGHYTDDLVVN